MIPLEFRNRRDSPGWRAQQHYEPFRPTLFSSTTNATHLGPGAFFKDKPFVTPPPASQQQPLYRMERDVNPTRVASVQRFYDASRATNVGGVLLERAGNAVASMKSAAPRFQPPQNDTSDATTQLRRGPGAYSPEKYHGAFTTTLERVTPAVARSEKLRAKRDFDASFAIIPSVSAAATSSSSTTDGGVVRGSVVSRMLVPSGVKRKWPQNRISPTPRAECDRVELESSSRQLVVALTPRNAYNNPVNRELVLVMRQHQQQRDGNSGDLTPSHTST